MFSLSFKPPSTKLSNIAILSKGELEAAHCRPPSTKLSNIANVSKGKLEAAHSRLQFCLSERFDTATVCRTADLTDNT